jgi:hypothetical protein
MNLTRVKIYLGYLFLPALLIATKVFLSLFGN